MDCSIRGFVTRRRRYLIPMSTTSQTQPLANSLQLGSLRSTPDSRFRGFFRRFSRNKGAVVATFILLFLIVISLDPVGSRLAPYDPTKILSGPKLTAPTGEHPFGTDQL